MSLPVKPISFVFLGHDYIARLVEIRKLICKGEDNESIAAIDALENDMQVVLAVGELYDSVNCAIN